MGGIYLATALIMPKPNVGDMIGPALFPIIVGISSILCGIFLCRNDKKCSDKKLVNWGFVTERGIWIKIIITVALGILYGMYLDEVGYMVTTSIFMLLVSMLINKGRFVQNVLLSVGFAVISYGVFALALSLSLPRGPLESMIDLIVYR